MRRGFAFAVAFVGMVLLVPAAAAPVGANEGRLLWFYQDGSPAHHDNPSGCIGVGSPEWPAVFLVNDTDAPVYVDMETGDCDQATVFVEPGEEFRGPVLSVATEY